MRDTHQNEQGLEYIKQVAGTLLVAIFKAISKNVDHSGDECLELFLYNKGLVRMLTGHRAAKNSQSPPFAGSQYIVPPVPGIERQ